MDCEHDARGCHGSCNRLRGAGGCIRAGVPSSTGLPRPAGTSPTSDHCRAVSPDRRLVGSGATPGSGGSPGTPANTGGPAPSERRRGPCGPPSGSGRSRSGRPESLLCLDIGLLGLEWPLGMGWWPLGRPAQANRRLGRRSLGKTWWRLFVDRRRLALAPKRPHPSPSASLAPTGPHGNLKSVSRRHQQFSFWQAGRARTE